MQFHCRAKCWQTSERFGALSRRLIRFLNAAAVILTVSAGSGLAARGASVTFGWDPVAGAASYRLYQGTSSGSYGQSVSATRTQATLSNLTAGVTYYFAVTAVGSNNVESPFSAEFSYAPPVAPPGNPSIALSTPNNQRVTGQGVNLTVSVSANGHTLKKVQYWTATGLLGESSTAPYSFTWASAPAGIQPVIARLVYDSQNYFVDSAPITLLVVPPGKGQNILANSGVISLPFLINSDGSLSQPVLRTLATAGLATFTFSVPQAGDYVISGNVLAADSSANSFYVNVDAEPVDPAMIWNLATGPNWTNQPVTWQGQGTNPKVFTLTAGTHQIVLRGREANAYIKDFTVSPAYSRLAASAYNNSLLVTGTGVAYRTYEVQATTDYKTWTVVGTTVADATGAISYLETGTGAGKKFYRVRDTLQ